jgi:quercetin dioxygenase-like cupin family protein
MKLLTATVISLFMLASAPAHAGQMKNSSYNSEQDLEITRSGSQPSATGSAEYFTGSVRVDTLFKAHEPSCTTGGHVTFGPGARTAWHTHPFGQTLIVTAGTGLIQRWGGTIEEIREGDVVWIPAGLKHWHGAAPNTAMTHIAIQEQLNGKVADWMEKVSDELYQPKSNAP